MSGYESDNPLGGAALIKHATRAAPRPHFIAEVDFVEQYEDAHQCVRLLRDGSIEAELHDWSEVARTAHGNAVSYILTIPFSAITDVTRGFGYGSRYGPGLTILEPTVLLAFRKSFRGYFELREFLATEGIPHAIAFDSWATTPQAA
jgi:hypothetical protein